MKQIVECVPNFSEGRNEATLKAIAAAIGAVAGVKLMGVEPDKDYNRTVVTFAGEPQAVVEAAVAATRVAAEKIDMRAHKGEHPRLGSVDVVPFVPVAGMTMDDCAQLARHYGKRVAEELHIPIYLYEYAATKPERRNLSEIRKGEYEGLSEKLKDPAWTPDFGKAEFNPKSGATVTGARKFLIAYNVNLKTTDVDAANEIGARIRESGRVKKDAAGKTVKNDKGEAVRIAGSLKNVKAMGVFLERFNIAQVSINLTDYEVTPPHIAFEEVKKEAKSLGIETDGSEIVGLTPLAALLMAGKYYASGSAHTEEELVRIAVESLGLSRLDHFDPKKKIIEYQLQ